MKSLPTVKSYIAIQNYGQYKAAVFTLQYRHKKKLFAKRIESDDNIEALYKTILLVLDQLHVICNIELYLDNSAVVYSINSKQTTFFTHDFIKLIFNYSGHIRAHTYNLSDPDARLVKEEAARFHLKGHSYEKDLSETY